MFIYKYVRWLTDRDAGVLCRHVSVCLHGNLCLCHGDQCHSCPGSSRPAPPPPPPAAAGLSSHRVGTGRRENCKYCYNKQNDNIYCLDILIS